MSKNYNEVSSQVAAVRTKDHTLAFYANLESVKLENFAELISGRIKVGINDFSKGKGDASVYGYYNLDLKDVKYLYTRALYSNMPVPFEGRKIHGAYPIQEGPDRECARLSILRSNGMPFVQMDSLPEVHGILPFPMASHRHKAEESKEHSLKNPEHSNRLHMFT